MQSAKNFMLSPAATDLGLGDALTTQLEDADAERRKKLKAQQMAQKMGQGGAGLGPATMSLYGAAGGFGV